MNLCLLFPILIPMTTGIVALFFWNHLRIQRIISILGGAGLFGSGIYLLLCLLDGGIPTVQIGGWPAPFGITLAADPLSVVMVLLTGTVGLAVSVQSLTGIDSRREAFGYYPLLHIMLMGVCGAFLTGDIFNLFVWFEVMLFASFVLLELGGERAQLEGTVKYLALNLVASSLFLSAVGLLYSAAGTLNMAHLAQRIPEIDHQIFPQAMAMLFIVAFGLKAAIFPFFFWLPASYHTPPGPVAAIFAGLLTKVGVYSLIRVFTLFFPGSSDMLLFLAGLTLVSGCLIALVQTHVRRVFSFLLVGHIGYMIMGLGLFTPLALAGAIFYLIHDIVDITALFLISGLIQKIAGTESIDRIRGLYRSHPFLALLFLVPALSLSGIPPFSGFWGKLILIRAGLEAKAYLLVGAGLVAAFLTLWVLSALWSDLFWRPEKPDEAAKADQLPQEERGWKGFGAEVALYGPVAGLALITLLLGIFAEPVYGLCRMAAGHLLDPSAYIGAVLGGNP